MLYRLKSKKQLIQLGGRVSSGGNIKFSGTPSIPLIMFNALEGVTFEVPEIMSDRGCYFVEGKEYGSWFIHKSYVMPVEIPVIELEE